MRVTIFHTEMLKINFPIEPVPKGRPRFTRTGHAYTPAKTRKFEKEIKYLAQIKWNRSPITGPISVELVFVMKRPNKPKKEYPRGDLDNFCKAVLDSCNGVIWNDDSQIVSICVYKKYGTTPNIELEVW